MPELIDKNRTEAKVFSIARFFIDRPDREVELVKAVIHRCCEEIDKQPTIEPEVRHGEWHECWHTDTVCASICTNCGKAATQSRTIVGQELMTNVRYPLCPNCGARMDGGADNA